MNQKEIAAYAAGLFDGEGYVGIDSVCISNGKRRLPHLGLRIVISQKDGAIMDWLKDNFGGNVYRQRNGSQYYIYRWRIHSEKAEQFLRFIYPYVLIKKPQVDLALSFNEEKKKRAKDSVRSGKTGRFTNLTDEELKWRSDKKEEMSRLKKVYASYTKSEVKVKE